MELLEIVVHRRQQTDDGGIRNSVKKSCADEFLHPARRAARGAQKAHCLAILPFGKLQLLW